MNKKVLIDLSKLKVLNAGLGQTAKNFGLELGKQTVSDLQLSLLTPKQFNGFFGPKFDYINTNLINRHLPVLANSFDLLHSTHQLPKYFSGSSKTPLLLTIHDLNFLYEKKPDKAEKYLKRVQRSVDRACMVTVISKFTASVVREHIDLRGKELRVIYNGVQQSDPDTYQKPDFAAAGTPFFFTIGQVMEKKNFHTLLDVMNLFPKKNLYICGETKTPYSMEIRNRIQNEKIGNVFLPGTISDEERGWLYQNCQAFVFPSKFEGFGLPVIEAMQHGKPVFSSEMTSLKEVGSHFAYFWEHFDPAYMASVVKAGLADFSNRPEFRKRQVEYALSFTYQKNIESYLNIYRELLGLNYNE